MTATSLSELLFTKALSWLFSVPFLEPWVLFEMRRNKSTGMPSFYFKETTIWATVLCPCLVIDQAAWCLKSLVLLGPVFFFLTKHQCSLLSTFEPYNGAHTRVYHLKKNANLWLHYCFQTSAKDCGGLATPTNGSSRGNFTTYPHEVTFKCDQGFNLRGSRIRQCLSSGNWSGNETTCEGNVKNRMHVVAMVD